jgi:hypothetical protein
MHSTAGKIVRIARTPSRLDIDVYEMFNFIDKATYWADLDNPHVAASLERTNREMICLKHVQDSWILGRLGQVTDQHILEIGGGWGRVLRTLDGNERWNLDVTGGPGRTVADRREAAKEYRLVNALLGEFSSDLPDGYFDIVFSISVMEHIPQEDIIDFWADHARVMKPGAVGFHAIDFYLEDDPSDRVERRLDGYLKGLKAAGLDFISPPTIERPARFRCAYATTQDLVMRHWNRISPAIKRRHLLQSVSLGLGVKKAD